MFIKLGSTQGDFNLYLCDSTVIPVYPEVICLEFPNDGWLPFYIRQSLHFCQSEATACLVFIPPIDGRVGLGPLSHKDQTQG
jgi:hypothetical protein